MVEQHIESGAAVTVAALRVPLAEADQFGVIETAADGRAISAFREKPTDAGRPARRARPGLRLDGQLRLHRRGAASSTSRATRTTRPRPTTWAATSSRRSSSAATPHVYDFSRNEVPGRPSATAATGATSARSTPTTTRTWTSSPSSPIFNLYNREWPILTWPDPLPPAKFVFDEDDGRRGQALDSMVCAGRHHLGRDRAALDPLARRARCTPTPSVEDSVLMQGVDVGRDAVVRRAIIDKNVRIAAGRRGRRRPRGRPRALHGLGRRRRRHPQGRPVEA